MADLALDRSDCTRLARGSPRLKRGGSRLWLGAALVAFCVLVALLAPLIAPHDPTRTGSDFGADCRRPGSQGGDPAYLLGTDSLGRCVLSRLIYSARTAVAVALDRGVAGGA